MIPKLDFRSDTPGNTLTDEERAAIDAFPEDRVHKVPTGRSALAVNYVWVPTGLRGEKSSGRLVSVDDEGKPMTRDKALRRLKGMRG